jgi:UPF0716 protein FxsA
VTAELSQAQRNLPERRVFSISRYPGFVFFVTFLVFIAGEIAAFVAVAEQIGFLWALVILIFVSALGPFIVKRVGFSVLAHTRDRLARGEVPTRELLDGLVVLIGGVLICVPGFIGDALGLLLMIGPVRHLVIRVSGQRIAGRVGTIRTGRWRVIDADPRSVREDFGFHPHVLESGSRTEEGADNT